MAAPLICERVYIRGIKIKKTKHQQTGYLLIVAAIAITLFAVLATMLIHLYLSSLSASSNQLSATQSLYIARAGLERSSYEMLRPDVSNRVACINLSTANTALGQGAYELTGTAEHPAAIDTLTANINAVTTNIPVSNGNDFSPAGRVIIDKEVIDYLGVNGNLLIRSQRGADNSIAVTHSNGTRVGQYQCSANATDKVPSVNPFGERLLIETNQLVETWAVGNNGRFIQWNYPNENAWNNSAGGTGQNINAISMLNYADGWAVGDNQVNNLIIRRWNPATTTWVAVPFNLNRDLDGVSAVSNSEAWTVGQRNGATYTILRWNSVNWCQLAIPGPSCGGKQIISDTPNNRRDLFAVHMVDTSGDGQANIGFAVGGRNANGHALRYDGVSFTDTAIPGGVGTLLSTVVISANEAWAAGSATTGNQGRILRWNGANWTVLANTQRSMLSISMLDTNGDGIADYGWAVGNLGRAYIYNGVAWTINNIPGGDTYRGVVVLAQNDVWAVGNNGRRAHWDGNGWTVITTGGQQLNAVAAIAHRTQPKTAWRESYQ